MRKVLIAAYEAGLADRLDLVRTVVAATEPNEALMRENPLSKLPTLTLPNGSALYDSTVIVEYFATTLAPGCALYPKDLAAKLIALRRQSLGDGLLDLMLLWLGERSRPEAQRSPVLLAANTRKFAAFINHLETEVLEFRNLPFDIGSLTIGCGLSYVGFRFPDLVWEPAHPNLSAWLADFHRRPSVLAVPVIDDLDAPIAPPARAPTGGAD